MIDSSSQIPSAHRGWQRWQYALMAVLVLFVLAPLDLPIARLCYTTAPSREFLRFVELVGDVGGYGLAVFVILVAAVVVSRTKFSRLPLLISMSLGAAWWLIY